MTSAAKAGYVGKPLIAAVNRCATQNQDPKPHGWPTVSREPQCWSILNRGALVLILGVALLSIFARAVNVAGAADVASGGAAPVLVELFTSEGCSSCPPADSLLGKLDGLQPVAGAQAIVLSEHVDYWNHDGWKDAYSSSFFTDRQKDYVQRLGAKEAYTPQMIVDGVAQLNGSNGPAVLAAVEKARGDEKVPVRISGVGLDGRTLKLHVVVEGLPQDSKAKKADVMVAVALNHAESHVSAGENKGRDIQHVAVAESITKVGRVERGKKFDEGVAVKLKGAEGLGDLRVIVFVQAGDGGAVVGAALAGK
jgi:hypothetical protein